MRVFRPSVNPIVEASDVPQKLPIDRPVVLYIRRSTGKQVKESIQSKIQQDQATERRLRAKGFTDIRKISTDDGTSGQKLIEDRPGLKELYRMITNREVSAIACYDASRLWRDTTHVWYNDFIQIIQKYRIPVIMFAQTYWPTSTGDMDKLREEFAHAAYLIRHFEEKVNPARLQAIELGQNYAGHSVPLGFLVAGVKGQRHYIIYEPHARLVRWLFKRYRELGGNLGALGRELRAMDFHFPPFENIEEVPHVGLHPDAKGYPVKARSGLVSILTNPAYIGYYSFSAKANNENGKREVVRTWVNKEAHEAIVPLEDFEYAYSRLSSETLDGETNEQKPKIERRYVDKKALLDGILESDGKPVYATMSKGTYSVCMQNGYNNVAELMISIERLDDIFSDAMRTLLLKLEQRHAKGLHDNLYAQLTEALQEQTEQSVNFAQQLSVIDRGIRQAQLDRKASLELEYEPGVKAAIIQLKRLESARKELEEKQKHTGNEETELREFQTLLDVALRSWDALSFDKQKRFVRLMVERVNIREETSHFIRIDIQLRAPFNYSLYGFLFRAHGSRSAWTEDEIAVLKRLYPQSDRLEVLQALPDRSWESIVKQACIMRPRLERSTRRNTSAIYEGLTYSDYALAEERDIETLGDSVKWVINLIPIKNNSDTSS
ncbi:MAG: recombinase family protein [Ktedonobacteraceae bacterium]